MLVILTVIERKTLDGSKGTSHNIPQHRATRQNQQYAQPEKQTKELCSGCCMLNWCVGLQRVPVNSY